MERNPDEARKEEYYKNVRYKKIRPLFFFERCDKCGKEYRRERMYELTEPSVFGFTWEYHKRGCTHCFPDMDSFKEWCRENVLLKDEDFTDAKKLLF